MEIGSSELLWQNGQLNFDFKFVVFAVMFLNKGNYLNLKNRHLHFYRHKNGPLVYINSIIISFPTTKVYSIRTPLINLTQYYCIMWTCSRSRFLSNICACIGIVNSTRRPKQIGTYAHLLRVLWYYITFISYFWLKCLLQHAQFTIELYWLLSFLQSSLFYTIGCRFISSSVVRVL